jgi:tRNA(fMet)-specific endonuclease VapC
MWFLDTNACIMFTRGQAQVCTRWRRHRAGELAIPMTVLGELLVGAEKSSQPERVFGEIEALIERHELIGVTGEVARAYARIRADLERRGTTIGENDLWIAATALAHDATLVTNNTAEFSRVPELKIEDWSQA